MRDVDPDCDSAIGIRAEPRVRRPTANLKPGTTTPTTLASTEPPPRGGGRGETRRKKRNVEFRGFSPPEVVHAERWSGEKFVLRRVRARTHSSPALNPLALRITFAEPVQGPMLLGREAHFSLGLMVPMD